MTFLGRPGELSKNKARAAQQDTPGKSANKKGVVERTQRRPGPSSCCLVARSSSAAGGEELPTVASQFEECARGDEEEAAAQQQVEPSSVAGAKSARCARRMASRNYYQDSASARLKTKPRAPPARAEAWHDDRDDAVVLRREDNRVDA